MSAPKTPKTAKPKKKDIPVKINTADFDLAGMVSATEKLTRLDAPLNLRLHLTTESIYSQSFPDLDGYFNIVKYQSRQFGEKTEIGQYVRLATKIITEGHLPFAMYPDPEHGRIPGPIIRLSTLKSKFRRHFGNFLSATVYGSIAKYGNDAPRVRALADEIIQRGGTQLARYTQLTSDNLSAVFKILASDAAVQLGTVLGSDFRGNVGSSIQFPIEARLDDLESIRNHTGLGFVWVPTVRTPVSEQVYETTRDNPLYKEFFATEKSFKNVMGPSPFHYYGVDAGLSFSAPIRFRSGTPVWVVNHAIESLKAVIEEINTNGGYGAHSSAGFGNVRFDLVGNTETIPYGDRDYDRMCLIGELFASLVSQTGPMIDDNSDKAGQE